MTPARFSTVEKHALAACIAIGLAAVGVCVLDLAGRFPISARDSWGGAPWIPFAIAVLIINLDAMLVVGARGARWAAVAGRVLLGVLLVLFTGFALILGWLAMGPLSAQVPIGFGAMAIVQWYCLMAVTTRLSRPVES